MCEFLISKGCNVNSRDKLGRTPLMDAAEIGSVPVIDVLIDNHADVDSEDKERHTALSYCIDFVNSKEPKFFAAAWRLVEKNANPNYSGKFANRTLLHCAAAQGEFERVKELVDKYHAAINVVDNDDKTPIEYAKDNNHEEIANYLQEQLEGQLGGCMYTTIFSCSLFFYYFTV